MTSRYTRTINKKNEPSSFWPTFTDMICSILMVVILLLFSNESIYETVQDDLANKITDKIEYNFENENIIVDEVSGKITFKESMMFDVDSYELKAEAKIMLNEFIPLYIKTIYESYGDNIDKITITGHTDDSGSYLHNLDLSQERALSVSKYIMSDEIGSYEYKDQVLFDIEAIGKSESELIKDKYGNTDSKASRRVEIMYELNIEK